MTTSGFRKAEWGMRGMRGMRETRGQTKLLTLNSALSTQHSALTLLTPNAQYRYFLDEEGEPPPSLG
jgi:hypothetical protein